MEKGKRKEKKGERKRGPAGWAGRSPPDPGQAPYLGHSALRGCPVAGLAGPPALACLDRQEGNAARREAAPAPSPPGPGRKPPGLAGPADHMCQARSLWPPIDAEASRARSAIDPIEVHAQAQPALGGYR
jgi:hypothetical protein